MSKREEISPNGDKRYVRRDHRGQFKTEVDGGKSLSADGRQKAKHESKLRQGDRGDHHERKPLQLKGDPLDRPFCVSAGRPGRIARPLVQRGRGSALALRRSNPSRRAIRVTVVGWATRMTVHSKMRPLPSSMRRPRRLNSFSIRALSHHPGRDDAQRVAQTSIILWYRYLLASGFGADLDSVQLGLSLSLGLIPKAWRYHGPIEAIPHPGHFCSHQL
jgi:hypothetical protein